MSADMIDPDLARCAQRLRRYARALGGPAHLTTAFFADEVNCSATAVEALNRLDLSRFRKLTKWLDHPRDQGGLMRWTRLRPKDLQAAADLSKIVLDFLADFCGSTFLVVQRQERSMAIKFRFLVATETHAHCGVFVFRSRAVEKLLIEARRLRRSPRT